MIQRGGLYMAKLAQNFAKYMIYATLKATGIVEKPDVIGAIFGQTEGLLGSDLDLRELQKTGRIGRIEVNIKKDEGMSTAHITIPSSLDSSETALIAASLETIDKVGPCEAEIKVEKVDDIRFQKREYVMKRAQEILKNSMDDSPDSNKISEMIKESVRTSDVCSFKGLSCGPEVETNEEIIVVEGRADVINLLRNGIKNCIAIEGSKIPKSVIELTREKTVTAFLDGDRGGDLDLKKLMSVADVDFVARADEGMEVEELAKKQIYKALRDKVHVSKLNTNETSGYKKTSYKKTSIEKIDKIRLKSLLLEILGTRAVLILDENERVIKKLPLSELGNYSSSIKTIHGIVFDGKINQDLIDLMLQKKATFVIGADYKEKIKHPGRLRIYSGKELNE